MALIDEKLDKIADRLEDIGKDLTTIRVSMAGLHESAKSRQDRLRNLEVTMFGKDGKDGIKDIALGVQQHCADVNDRCASPLKQTALNVAGRVVANGLTALIVWLLYLYVAHAQQLPRIAR